MRPFKIVATVLTVYGIETLLRKLPILRTVWLQQYLPFTVLKPPEAFKIPNTKNFFKLQQYLPFTVLKRAIIKEGSPAVYSVATVLTVYGIETPIRRSVLFRAVRLLQQYLPFTVLKR